MTEHSERLLLPAGATLFVEGDAGDVAYLIKRGRVGIYLNRQGQEIAVATRGPGELVGEMAIIDAGRRSAAARAIEECELLVITAEQIAHRLQATDPILRMCLSVVLARYRETVALLGHDTTTVAASLLSDIAQVGSADFNAAIETLVLERALRQALDHGELVLFYQPIVQLQGRCVAGFEALARWQHPERGLVPPDQFIPLAESSGLIVQLTQWALGEVGRVFPTQLAPALIAAGAPAAPFISVNVTAIDLARGDFIATLRRMLSTSGLPARSLKIEVTESVLMQDPAGVARTLQACRALGAGIAVDDFGTGYSSLSSLSLLPISTLKVDRSFVRSMLSEPASRKIVQTILRLAEELGLPVIAEGIEEEAQARALAAMGCAFGQGYLFGRPVPLAATLELLRGWRARGTERAEARPIPAPIPAIVETTEP